MINSKRDRTWHFQDTLCDCGARMEIVINDMAEWVMIRFIAEHNHPRLATLSITLVALLVHQTNAVHWLM